MAAGVNVKKPRIQSIDILKGGAIIGVVAAHLMFIQNSQAIEDSFNFVFNAGELLYAALPMFLVLSGYFYKPGDLWYNIKRKVIPLVTGLVVCTVVLTVIMYYYLGFLGYDLSNSDL
ncbi:MAG: acyltransferase family protein, partial [Candidatus Methanomethylophilaceae archaeon]|nr:acyltransferase family protein [Candidatus Methanomethylophilaceae archaeon]